jgi:hypothetical protein
MDEEKLEQIARFGTCEACGYPRKSVLEETDDGYELVLMCENGHRS